MKTGQTHMHRYMRPLVKRVEAGEIDPSFVITHRLALDEETQVTIRCAISRTAASRLCFNRAVRLRSLSDRMRAMPIEDFGLQSSREQNLGFGNAREAFALGFLHELCDFFVVRIQRTDD